MTHFKVLPTDPSYQKLNLFQKVALLYAVDKDIAEKLDLAKIVLERLEYSINPAIYPVESSTEEPIEGTHVNIAFEQQSKFGRATGKMLSPKPIRKAIDKFYDYMNSGKRKESTVFCNLDENPDDDENVLG